MSENTQIRKGVTIYSLTMSPKGPKQKISIGNANLTEGQKHYHLNLNMYPGKTFYLTKNKKGANYTVFSHCESRKSGEIRLRKPVGFGTLDPELKGHLKICFNFPRGSFFMSLYPKREILGGPIEKAS